MKVSVIIRTLNEARHLNDLLLMIARQKTSALDIEIVIVDSGSSDATLAIAAQHRCRIEHIAKAEFSFGRSLNRGCSASSGEIFVFVSGHCVPVNDGWIQALCQPIIDDRTAYTYGRQIGDDDSNYSERRIFAKYFPDESVIPQKGFLCNNANAALRRSVWEAHPFDEDLTGLEDMELAKRLVARGMSIGYVAEAPVFHHHQESWAAIRRRFEREALALRSIMPEVHLSRFDVLRYIVSSVYGDWCTAARKGIRSTSRLDMLRYRYNQFVGAYHGNHEHRRLSQAAKERFYYPLVDQKAEQDDWLGPLRRSSPHESQQPAGERQEFQTSR